IDNFWLPAPTVKVPDLSGLLRPTILEKYIPQFSVLYAGADVVQATGPKGRWITSNQPMTGFQGQMGSPVTGLSVWYKYMYWSKPFQPGGAAFLHVRVLESALYDFGTANSASEGWLSLQFGLSGDRSYLYTVEYATRDTEGAVHEGADGEWCGVNRPAGYE